MKNYKKDLLDKIIGLYNMYDGYMWRHEDAKLNILLQENTISFYLYNDKEELDNIILTFSDKENMLYRYISIKILLEMINDVIVHIDENEFQNSILKPYLKLIVNDDGIFEIMSNLVDRQMLEIISDDTDSVKNIRNLVINPIFYPTKVIRELDERIGITRKLLRMDGK